MADNNSQVPYNPYGNLTGMDCVNRGRVLAAREFPFLYGLLMYLTARRDDDAVPTAGVTESGYLSYNEKWVTTKMANPQVAMTVMAHEVLHLALCHPTRERQARMKFHEVANIAMDLSINMMIVDMNLGHNLPEGGILPTKDGEWSLSPDVKITNIREKTMEELYKELMSHIPQVNVMVASGKIPDHKWPDRDKDPGQGQGKDGKGDKEGKGSGGKSGKDGEGQDSQGGGGKDKGKDPNAPGNATDEEWKRRLTDAVALAESRGGNGKGSVPAGMMAELKNLHEPKLPWTVFLRQFVERCSGYGETTWRRPSRRGLAINEYLPSTDDHHCKVVFHVDTSGSMPDEDLEGAASELKYLLGTIPGIEVKFIACDCDIQFTCDLTGENADEVFHKIEMRGRGGTSHSPVVDYVNEMFDPPRLLVTITDGCSDMEQAFARLPPHIRVLTVLTEGTQKDVKKWKKYGDATLL